jgi:hypothetical protein
VNWIKVSNSLPAHPKILIAGDRAAWLFVCGLCYCNEHLTDGYIAKATLPVAAPGIKGPERLAKVLVEVGLWELAEGGWQIHDYTEFQRSARQVKDVRRKDRERKAHPDSSDTFRSDSARIPSGFPTDSNGTPDGLARSREEKREEQRQRLTQRVEAEG